MLTHKLALVAGAICLLRSSGAWGPQVTPEKCRLLRALLSGCVPRAQLPAAERSINAHASWLGICCGRLGPWPASEAAHGRRSRLQGAYVGVGFSGNGSRVASCDLHGLTRRVNILGLKGSLARFSTHSTSRAYQRLDEGESEHPIPKSRERSFGLSSPWTLSL